MAAFRAECPLPAVARLYDAPPDFAPRAHYAAFVARHRGDLSLWPVMDAQVQRLCADVVTHIARFAAMPPKMPLRSARPFPHGPDRCRPSPPFCPPVRSARGGRSVLQVTFADGARLAYKPRSWLPKRPSGTCWR